MSELQILFPEPAVIGLGGKDVSIYPVKLRHFELYGKVAGSLVELFANASVQQINRYAEKHSGDLKRVLRATTSLNRWQLWSMPSSVAVQVMAQVVKANSDFFAEALPEVVRALAGPLSPSA